MPVSKGSIIFFGSPQFAIPTLKLLLEKAENVSLVVTQPDKPKGRGKEVQPTEVKKLALKHGLPVIEPVNLRDREFLSRIESLKPEIAVVVAYGKILPKELLTIPRYGCINLHASLLPKYRGAAPIQWALINGETVTGVTTMLIDEGLDTGPILLQREVPIDDEDNAITLSEKLSQIGAQLVLETVVKLREGAISAKPQQGEPSYAPQLKKEQGRIDWSASAREIFNLVRGTYPWPSAYCFFRDERVKLIKTRVLDGEAVPGLVVKAKEQLVVGTAEGLLEILLIQPEGKRVMTAKEFTLGRRINEGLDRFS